jgi:uridine kinase
MDQVILEHDEALDDVVSRAMEFCYPLLIVISGGSGSGKSTLARNMVAGLVKKSSQANATILALDHYYKDFDDSTMPHSPDGRVLFDAPESFWIFPFLFGIRRLLSGKSLQRPHYDQRVNKQTDYRWVQPAPIVIAEGLFAVSFANNAIWHEQVIKIFLESDLALCRERRLERDVRELGETPEQVAKMFDEQVVPCYYEYVLPQRALADIIIKPPVAETRKESNYAE